MAWECLSRRFILPHCKMNIAQNLIRWNLCNSTYNIGLSSMAGGRSLRHDRAPSGRDLIFKACNYKTGMYSFKTNALIKISVSVFELKKITYGAANIVCFALTEVDFVISTGSNHERNHFTTCNEIIMSSNVCKISFFILTEIVTIFFCRN